MAVSFVESFLTPLRLLVRDFKAFAGLKGLNALLFVFVGAVVDSVGLMLLIPFISTIIDLQHAGDKVDMVAAWFFALFAAESRLARLSLLVAVFGILMVGRAVIITLRDVTMAQLQIGFMQHLRSRITAPPCGCSLGHTLPLTPQPYHSLAGRGYSAARQRHLHPYARRGRRCYAGESDCARLSIGACCGGLCNGHSTLGCCDSAADGQARARNRDFRY